MRLGGETKNIMVDISYRKIYSNFGALSRK